MVIAGGGITVASLSDSEVIFTPPCLLVTESLFARVNWTYAQSQRQPFWRYGR
jgi:hypothetical protein